MRFAVALLACTLPCPLLTQEAAPDTSEIAAGDAVRITAPSLDLNKWRGFFVHAEVDSVTVRDSASGGTLRTLPLEQITKFEVNHGNRPAEGNAAEGGAIGLLAGAVIGVVGASSVSWTRASPSTRSPIARSRSGAAP